MGANSYRFPSMERLSRTRRITFHFVCSRGAEGGRREEGAGEGFPFFVRREEALRRESIIELNSVLIPRILRMANRVAHILKMCIPSRPLGGNLFVLSSPSSLSIFFLA